MLYCADQQVTPAIRETTHNDVRGLRGTGSKHNSLGITIDRIRNLHSRHLDRLCSVLSESMLSGVWIRRPSQPWQHDLQNPVINCRRGLMI